MYMNPCQFDGARRGFFKKSAAVAALYLTPSVLVKTFAADNVVPMPIAKECEICQLRLLNLDLRGKCNYEIL